MCIRENNAMVLRRDYNPDFLDLKSRLAPDIYFITREKLKIPAHKEIITYLVLLVSCKININIFSSDKGGGEVLQLWRNP